VEVSRIEAYLDRLRKVLQKLLIRYQDLALLLGPVDLGEHEIVDDVLRYSDDLIGVPPLRISEKSEEFRKNLSFYFWRSMLIEVILEILPNEVQVQGRPQLEDIHQSKQRLQILRVLLNKLQ
jgi:hypothetical protein